MKKVVLYTTQYCPFCQRALRRLDKKGIDYTNVDVGKDRELLKQISAQTGWDTVPQIFIEDQFIGGCDELLALDADGKLDALLGIGSEDT